jgi:hypothetical protein
MGHISDRTLDNLLDGSIDDESELAIEEHVRHCARCAHRLREWELLFPQIKSLIPTGEHPAAPGEYQIAGATAGARSHGPSVFIPEWSPPRVPHALPTKLAWGLVAVLAVGAGYLLLKRDAEESPVMGFLPDDLPALTGNAKPADSTGLGSGIPTTAVTDTTTPLAQAESTTTPPATVPASQPEREAEPQPERETEPPPQVASRENQEQDVRVPTPRREEPVRFPIRVDTGSTQSATQPAGANPPPEAEPLPAHFQRVSLGEAINRLAGTVRLIQGLNPEAVEIAQGSALPGADPDRAVVRVVYNAPEGRLILDQQRLGRAGSREPNIAISTSPSGVSVAQWVDRGGFWISLAGRADQQTLLAIANRIR